jgi:hypothetical protein
MYCKAEHDNLIEPMYCGKQIAELQEKLKKSDEHCSKLANSNNAYLQAIAEFRIINKSNLDKLHRRNLQIKDLKAKLADNEPKDYNGWSNYETWNYKLWLDNDEGSYNYWQETARQILDNAKSSEYFTARQNAETQLAEALKAEIEESNPLKDTATTYTDLLNASISEINFHEIAKAILEDLTVKQ